MESYKKMTALLASEFDRYLMEHSSVEKKIPRNALIVFQVNGESGFNRWSEKLALKHREREQPVVYVRVKDFQTTSSLKEVLLEKAAV
jgi:hypothetical protein